MSVKIKFGEIDKLLKSPHSPNIVFVALVVVELLATTEALFPRVVNIVLGGTPIEAIYKAANRILVHIKAI